MDDADSVQSLVNIAQCLHLHKMMLAAKVSISTSIKIMLRIVGARNISFGRSAVLFKSLDGNLFMTSTRS